MVTPGQTAAPVTHLCGDTGSFSPPLPWAVSVSPPLSCHLLAPGSSRGLTQTLLAEDEDPSDHTLLGPRVLPSSAPRCNWAQAVAGGSEGTLSCPWQETGHTGRQGWGGISGSFDLHVPGSACWEPLPCVLGAGLFLGGVCAEPHALEWAGLLSLTYISVRSGFCPLFDR